MFWGQAAQRERPQSTASAITYPERRPGELAELSEKVCTHKPAAQVRFYLSL